ncbi:MAG: tetratricopeptide repeat protein, partial [Planctomycetes bacterium]|nr:tetratricopeptide repeat protein [Planctomycetota bacterium]
MSAEGLLDLDDGGAPPPAAVAISTSRSGWSAGEWDDAPLPAPAIPPGHPELAAIHQLACRRHFDQARTRLAAAESASPRPAWLRTAALVTEEDLQDEEALGLWRELVRAEPAALDAHLAITTLLEPRIGVGPAADLLVKALGRRSGDRPAMRFLFDWLRRPGLGERRLAVVRALAGAMPADPWVQRELAWALIEQGEPDPVDAGIANQRAERAQSGTTAGQLLAAELAWRSGDRRGARERWLDVLRGDPACAPAVERLACAAGANADAFDALQSAAAELRMHGCWSRGIEAWMRLLPLVAAPATAAREYEALLRDHPDAWQAHAACAGHALRSGQAAQARPLLDQACTRFPGHAPLWELLAAAAAAAGDAAGERQALERALAADPTAAGALRTLAARSEPAQARALHLDDCGHHPRDPEAHLLLARLLAAQGDGATARTHLVHAAALAPRDERAWGELAAADPDGAETLAAELCERRPADPERWLRLAATLERRGPAAAARRLDCASRAAALAPREVRCHLLLARSLSTLGRHQEADDACEPPAYGGRAPTELRRLCAQLRRARGDTAGAVSALNQLLTRLPNDLDARLELSRLLIEHGDVREAVVEAEHAARLHPDSVEAHAVRGEALMRLGDRPGALASLARAL